MPLLSTMGAASARGFLRRIPWAIPEVRLEVWSGGSTSGPGGTFTLESSKTLQPGGTYTVTVGAADTNSSVVGAGINVVAQVSNANSGAILDGTVVTTTSGANTVLYANQGGYFPFYDIYAYGGSAGAGGSGASASGSVFNLFAGNGGNTRTTLGSGRPGFVGQVGAGGGAAGNNASWGVYYFYCDWYGDCYYAYAGTGTLRFGNTPAYGANTGNGYGYNGANPGVGETVQTRAASSGGFMMRYSAANPPLSSTTGTVVYELYAGYHFYFWTTSGSFSV